MSTLLKIDVSPRGEHSISRNLGEQFTGQWLQANANGKVISRDLAKTELPFVDLPWIVGAFSVPDQHTTEQKDALKISDELVAELLAADEILISTPMYNFNVPAALKAWIDHIVRVGKTFSYGPQGLKGLAEGKKATIIIASGSDFTAGSPYEAYNQESPYLRIILGFIGITDVNFVLAGGTNALNQGKISQQDFLASLEPEVLAAAGK